VDIAGIAFVLTSLLSLEILSFCSKFVQSSLPLALNPRKIVAPGGSRPSPRFQDSDATIPRH
jgi:hypothetical protein